jgi:hypothetical protein
VRGLTRAKWPVLCCFLLLLALAGWLAPQIAFPTDVPQIFPADHNVQRWRGAEASMAVQTLLTPLTLLTLLTVLTVLTVLTILPPSFLGAGWGGQGQG